MNALNNFFKEIKFDPETTCWNWIGSVSKVGYGKFYIYYKYFPVHRFSYELFKGKIPFGLVIDHLCKNTICVNPDHLEAVTQRENIMRGMIPILNKLRTHCKHGHEFDKENTYITKEGKRKCRACGRTRQIQYNQLYRDKHK